MNVSGRYCTVFDLSLLFVHKQRLALNDVKLVYAGQETHVPCGSKSENICTMYEPGHYGLKIK